MGLVAIARFLRYIVPRGKPLTFSNSHNAVIPLHFPEYLRNPSNCKFSIRQKPMNFKKNEKLNKADQLFQRAFSAHQAGRLSEAKNYYQQVLKVTPADMESHYLLGTIHSQMGAFGLAMPHLKKALSLAPNHVETLNNLGLTLKGMRRAEEALVFYRRALELKPDYADARNNLGNALELLGQLDEAEHHLRKALELNPTHADAYCNLGLVLNRKDQFSEAAQCFIQGLRIQPNNAISFDYLGQIYKIWGRFEQALQCMNRAVELSPDTYSPHNNRGTILEELGHYDEALQEYQRAAEIAPDDMTPRWNQAFLFLRQGMLERGWEAHELRLQHDGQVSIRFPYPQWDGSSLEGKTLLIYAEQGLGDEIMFGSCIPDVINQAKHCVIECAPRLASLYKRSFPTATVVGSPRMEVGWLLDAPKIDVQVAVGSLPRFLRRSLKSFPERTAYLVADPHRIAHWRSRLAALGPGLKVGICWRSGLLSGERHKYYSDLTQWGDVFSVPGVHFVNLQYGECAAELAEAREKFSVPITAFDDIDLREQIDESAALMASLDLVISAATAVSEIAGSQGIESYRLNSYGKQWEVLGRTDYMPWHPNTRLFDQILPGDWDTQLAMVAEALREKVEGHTRNLTYISMKNGIKVAVPPSLENFSHYVLKEQEQWFEPEYEFLINLAHDRAQIVDVGSDVGAYALALAHMAPEGRVLAISDTADEANMLMRSRACNKLEDRLQVVLAEHELCIDRLMDRHGLDKVSLVRLAANVCNVKLLQQASLFFARNSPLVMFGIQSGRSFDASVVQWFLSHGYAVFRLVPGLGVLTPCTSTDELDVYATNLFACRPDRAEILQSASVLMLDPLTLNHLPGIEAAYWQDFLAKAVYAYDLIGEWTSAGEKPKDWEVYWMSLHLFAMSHDRSRTVAERVACLQTSGAILTALVKENANLPRLLTLCRVLSELGRREMAVNLLNQICTLLDNGMSSQLDEPFLALDEAFSSQAPGHKQHNWAVAMVLAQREKLRSFSTYMTGRESLMALNEVNMSGFGSNDIRRRIDLIQERYRAC